MGGLAGTFTELGHYNQWANDLVYSAAEALSNDQRYEERGAFFGSVFGTLSHLLIADRIWLFRLTGVGPTYDDLAHRPYADFTMLKAARSFEDRRIVEYITSLEGDDLEARVTYQNMAGEEQSRTRAQCLVHFFNHQTHHRGQVHGLLSGFGLTPPSLDLIKFQAQTG